MSAVTLLNTAPTATVEYLGDLRTELCHVQSGARLHTDAPVDNQGKGAAFSPTDLVATSLASCMMTVMGIKARDLAIDLTGTRIAVTKIMTSDPRRISGIKLHIQFPPQLRLDERQQTLLRRTAHTCPVSFSLHPDIVVETHFEWAAS